MRLIFAGTPDFAVPTLQMLMQEHDVVAVYTQPDRRAGRGKKIVAPPVKICAQEQNISIHQPHKITQEIEFIESLQPDLMVVVAYGMILPQALLELPKYGCINVHASLLPRWRGAAPIQRALEAGDSETGVSIMRMEAGLDTGPVYAEKRIAITDEDTSQSLHQTLSELGAQALSGVLQKIESGEQEEPKAQDESGVTYAHKLAKSDAEIDWELSARAIELKVRAFDPWPVCQCHINGERLRVWSAKEVEGSSQDVESCGTVTTVSDHGIEVQCGKGILRLTELQRDGGRRLSVTELLNGFEISKGSCFT